MTDHAFECTLNTAYSELYSVTLLKRINPSWPFLWRPLSTRARSLRRVVLLKEWKHLDGWNWLWSGCRIHEVYAAEFPLASPVNEHRRDIDIVVHKVAVDIQETQHFL